MQLNSPHGGADVVCEVAGSDDSFRLAWEVRPTECDRLDCCTVRQAADASAARYVRQKPHVQDRRRGWLRHRRNPAADRVRGQLDTTPLITHIFPLNEIEAAYDLFEKRRDGVMKVAITPPEK